jgi:hypothetical protein
VSGRFRIGLEWIETRAMITPVVSAVPWAVAFPVQAERSIVVDPKSPGGVDSPHGLILLDGVASYARAVAAL